MVEIMDETTRTIIQKITVQYQQPQRIPSGELCSVFYDCVRLSPNDLSRLAAQAVGDVSEHTFEVAVGLAYGGILFAAAVAGGQHAAILKEDGSVWGVPLAGKKVVIVDDVVHTGGRLRKAEGVLAALGARVVGYSCIVNRSGSDQMSTGKPLWSAFVTDMR